MLLLWIFAAFATGVMAEDAINTCYLTGDPHVVTFQGIKGLLNFHCRFHASMMTAMSSGLAILISAESKDRSQSGYHYVSGVEVQVSLGPPIATYSVNAEKIKQKGNVSDPDLVWTKKGELSMYKNFVCIGYKYPVATFSVKNPVTNICVLLFTFKPKIQGFNGKSGLTIAGFPNFTNNAKGLFPFTLCGGIQQEDQAWRAPFKGLDTDGQKFLYGLLDQRLPQPTSKLCQNTIDSFKNCPNEMMKIRAVQSCEKYTEPQALSCKNEEVLYICLKYHCGDATAKQSAKKELTNLHLAQSCKVPNFT